MRIGLALALLGICLVAAPQQQKITVIGKLTRAMAIGGESTGWAIQFESEMTIDGKQVHSIEDASQDIEKLERLENKQVRAGGMLSHRNGVETGDRSILNVSSIKEVKAEAAFNLAGSEWLLE